MPALVPVHMVTAVVQPTMLQVPAILFRQSRRQLAPAAQVIEHVPSSPRQSAAQIEPGSQVML